VALHTDRRIASNVKTADGKSHPVVGYIETRETYERLVKPENFIIIPSVDKRVILMRVFWKLFELAPILISSARNDGSENCSSNIEYSLHYGEFDHFLWH